MAGIRPKRLAASTLLETIVALVIILVIFGIVTGFLGQTTQSSFSARKIRANQLLNRYAEETDAQKSFFDEEQQHDDLLLKRRMVDDQNVKMVVRIDFSATDEQHRVVSSQQRLFYIK
jgi:Tfp pilus assembly protein PilV